MSQYAAPWNRALFILLHLFAMALSAVAGEAMPRTFQVNYDKTPLKNALSDMQEKSGFKISFADKMIAGAAPVTLRREKISAEEILRELLRPEGLEAVQTDETLIAVVPAYSDLGMSKAFGRVIATGIRLAHKLDGAVLAGDEVRVPEWVESDDVELARGLADFIAAAAYFEIRRNRGDDTIDKQLERLLNSYDPLVRAGATLPAIFNGMRQLSPELGASIEKGMKSPYAAERAGCALMFAASLERTSTEFRFPNPEKTVATLAADPEASVRMATSIALLIGVQRNLKLDEDCTVLERLLKDRSMFVRQTPRFMVLADPRMLTRMEDSPSAKRLRALATNEGIGAMCQDPNPIARAVSLGFALALTLGKEDRFQPLSHYLLGADVSRDPWMAWIHKKLKPIIASEPSIPLAELRDALLSEKRSHQIAVLALCTESLMIRQMMSRAKSAKTSKSEPIPDLAGLAALSQSKSLWARLAGTLADGMAPAAKAFSQTTLSAEQLDAAEKRFKGALNSGDESVRLVALLSLQLRKMLRLPDLEGGKAEDHFLRAAQSRAVAEMMLGTHLCSQQLPADRIIAELERMLADNNLRTTSELLLSSIQYGNQHFRTLKPEQQQAFWSRLAELVIAQQDARLESALVSRLAWGSQERQKGILPIILKQGQIGTVLALCPTGNPSVFREEENLLLLADRLNEAAEDKGIRKQLLNAWHQLASSHEAWINTIPPNMLKALNSALSDAPADAEEERIRVLALLSYWSLQDRGNRNHEALLGQPQKPASSEMQRIFSLVVNKKQVPKAPTLVAKTVEIGRRKNIAAQWATHCPTLLASAESALRAIVESDRIDDKMEAWVPLVRSGDQASVNSLANLVNEVGLSPEHMSIAVNVLVTNTTLLPKWYPQTLLRLALDRNQNLDVRAAAINSAGFFSKELQPELEALTFDATASERLRTHAAHAAGISDTTRVFQKALDTFDTHPAYLISALLDRAIYSLQAPGAADFVLRALPEKRLLAQPNAWMRFNSLSFSLGQERAIAAFKDPQKLVDALDSVEKNWPAEERREFTTHVLPELKKVRQKIAELKTKAAAKNKPATPAVRPPAPPSDDF